MQSVNEESAFRELFIEAQRLVAVDSGREPTTLQRLIFDDAELLTPGFLRLLQFLMGMSDDTRAYYLVLSPDPIRYLYHFNKYPLLDIGYRDSLDDYLALLNEDPGGSPADAVGTVWSVSVIFPRGGKWFSHLQRSASDDGGHLWIPREWADKVIEGYSYLRKVET